MKNVLVVCEDLRINQTSAGIGRSKFVKLLYESGFKITVLTENNFTYVVDWLPENVSVRKFNIPPFQKMFFENIPKVKAIPVYLTGFSRSFRNTINAYKKEIQRELSNQKFDYIYALGSGSSFVPHFALAEMELPVPFFVNIHDPFPMHIYPEPYKKPKTWLNTRLQKKFKTILGKAKGISFPSQFLLEDMAETFPVINQKGFVIPHIGTTLDNLPIGKEDDKIQLDKQKINILHAGTLLGPRNPKFLLQAISEINSEHPDFLDRVAFTFIGKINKVLEDVVNNSNLGNVHFLQNRVSYQRSIKLIEKADMLLVIEAISDFSPFLPGKVADIAFAEKLIIALSPKKSEVRRLLGNNYPYQTELDNVGQIKDILLRIYHKSIYSKIDRTTILDLKNYVSVNHNSEIIRKYIN